MIVVIALILSGILASGQAMSGFGSPVVIMVAALLIIGEMLDRTGIAHSIGNLILRYGGNSETRLLVFLMVGAGILGSVMSSTAIVAIFVPIILRIAAKTGLHQSRLLLPMSYAALISGMLTLIATAPNLVVSDTLQEGGYEPLGFFSFFPIGLFVPVVAILYSLTIARPMLAGDDAAVEAERPSEGTASRRASSLKLLETFALLDKFYLVSVVHKPQSDLRSIFSGINARVLARKRPPKRKADAFVPEMELMTRDACWLSGNRQSLPYCRINPHFALSA
nr:SLC13 family permease [Ruegeria arenilitoris]